MSESVLQRAVKRMGTAAVLEAIPPAHRARLVYEWRAWARPEQIEPPGDWRVWLVLAGRGFGKTRLAMEWVRELAFKRPGIRIALIARTAADVRSVLLEGPSGLLNISPPWFMPNHEPSKCKVTWPNGSVALTYSSEEPRGLRGPEFDAAVCDELAAWPTLKDEDGEPGIPGAWTQLQYGLRRPGARPRVLVTTTPRPVKIIRELSKAADVHLTRGKTNDNKANLAPEFIEAVYRRYGGTRLGRQELGGELLDDVQGALWTHALVERTRVHDKPHSFDRIVVGVDPAGSAKRTADETGIVVAGIAPCRCLGREEMHGFVLEDLSERLSPEDMSRTACGAYHRWQADRVVAEDNFGGEMVRAIISGTDSTVAYRRVHASRGKTIRAEPVAALYEQGKVHHLGLLPELEDEMTTYTVLTPMSPGRMDALVWAITDLMIDGQPAALPEGGSVTVPRRDALEGDDDDDDDRWGE